MYLLEAMVDLGDCTTHMPNVAQATSREKILPWNIVFEWDTPWWLYSEVDAVQPTVPPGRDYRNLTYRPTVL